MNAGRQQRGGTNARANTTAKRRVAQSIAAAHPQPTTTARPQRAAMAAGRQGPLARLRRTLPARCRRRPGRDPDRDADLPRGARRGTICLMVRDGTFQLDNIAGRITMRMITATLAILSIAACGQPDITRERGYIARC